MPKIILLIFILSCSTASRNPSSIHIIEESIREDLDQRGKESMLRLQNGCSGFWVKNDGNKSLAATARHCLKKITGTRYSTLNQIEKLCQDKKIYFTNTKAEKFYCKKIAIFNKDHDLFIMEVDGKASIKKELVLSEIDYRYGLPLMSYGYPADPIRKGRATKTFNCHSLSHPVSSVDRVYKRFVYHNCSTWGGNSGGPLLIEATDYVIGIPGAYQPRQNVNYKLNRYSETTHLEMVSDFIKNNQKEILNYQILTQKLSFRDYALNSFEHSFFMGLMKHSFKYKKTYEIKHYLNKGNLKKNLSKVNYNLVHIALRAKDYILALDLLKLNVNQHHTIPFERYNFDEETLNFLEENGMTQYSDKLIKAIKDDNPFGLDEIELKEFFNYYYHNEKISWASFQPRVFSSINKLYSSTKCESNKRIKAFNYSDEYLVVYLTCKNGSHETFFSKINDSSNFSFKIHDIKIKYLSDSNTIKI